MTDNDTRRTERSRTGSLTRRKVLAGIGAAGLFGTSTLTDGQRADGATADPARLTWTARRRSKFVRYSDGRFRAEGDHSNENERRESESVPLHSVDAVSSLQYLGAAWHPYANPDPDSGDAGAWQHTFVLSNFALGQQLFTPEVVSAYPDRYETEDHFPDLRIAEEAYEDTGTVVGRPPRYAPVGFHLRPGLRVRTHDSEADDNVVDNVAVSARRDLDLFRFLDPRPIVDTFEIQTDRRRPSTDSSGEAQTGSLDAVGDRIAMTRGDAYVDFARVRRSFDVARQGSGGGAGAGDGGNALQTTKGAIQNLVGLAANADRALTAGDEAAYLTRTAAFDDTVLKRLGYVETALKVGSAAAEWWNGPRPVDRDALQYFNGFDRNMPNDLHSVGSGVVLFDVYVTPGTAGTVEVTSRVDMSHDDNAANPLHGSFSAGTQEVTWLIDVTGPNQTDPQYVSESDRFNAEIADTAFESVNVDPDEEDWRSPSSWPTIWTSFEERPKRPSPSISPGGNVDVQFETVDGVRREQWSVSEGDTVSFDAHDTVLCAGPIEHYRWELCRVTGDRVAVVDSASGSDASVFEPSIPPLEGADGVRVRLWVRDADAEVRTDRDLLVEGAPPPTPSIETLFDDPVAGADLSFDGTDSSTPTGSIEHYSWDVVGMPQAVRERLENAPAHVWSGTGETFSFVPSEPGEYAVSLSITDSRGYVRSTRVSVTVVEGSATAVIEPTFETARAAQPATFDGSGSSVSGATVESYEWSVVATPEDVDVAPDETVGETLSFTPPTAGTYEVQLTVSGDGRTDATTLEFAVAEDAQPTCGDQPVEGRTTVDGRTVCDVDGDGLYRDVDGSGTLGSNDVVSFFDRVESEAVQGNAEYFDFNDSGAVGFEDVVALFGQL